jgi:hypothetical protein
MIMFRVPMEDGRSAIATVDGAILVAWNDDEAARAPESWEQVPYPPDTLRLDDWFADVDEWMRTA